MTSDRRRATRGFTLIEVLVALAIIAFGLIAVFGQLNQSATAAARLRDKTFAHWVAMNRIAELRLAGGFPPVGTQSDDLEMANLRWHYEIRISKTDDESLRRADVSVALADQQQRPLATAVGFLVEPPKSKGQPAGAPGQAAATGWPLLTPGDDKEPEAPPPAPAPGKNEAKAK